MRWYVTGVERELRNWLGLFFKSNSRATIGRKVQRRKTKDKKGKGDENIESSVLFGYKMKIFLVLGVLCLLFASAFASNAINFKYVP
jgi:hypothetical protein